MASHALFRTAMILLGAVAMLTPATIPAQAPASPSPPEPAAKDLEEVVVKARRLRLAELRREITLLEDRFYDRYNALNGRDIFDIHCSGEARTGTRLERRYCRAEYEIRAYQTEGSEHYWAIFRMMGGDPKAQQPVAEWIPPQPPAVQIERRRKDFRRTLLEVTRTNPELLDILRQRSELAEEYLNLLGASGDAAP